MTLEDIYYISQIVAVVAILASLAAVYWQVRQTNKIARADLTHSAWLQTGQMQLSLYDTPEKADLMNRALRGTGPLSDAESLRMDAAIAVALGVHEAGFNLRQRGLIEAGTYNALESATRDYMRSAYVRDWWAQNRNKGRDADYVALLDGMVANVEAKRAAKSGREGPLP